MNDRDKDYGTTDPLAGLNARQRKLMRKAVRKFIRADLQRRAITGEPSQFKRAAYGAQL